MKLKKIFITVGIVIGVVLVGALGLVSWFFFQVKDFNQLKTAQINESVSVVEGSMANMFLIKAGTRYIAIDAGDGIQKINTGLQQLSISPDSISAVFLTHSDGDHVAGLGFFKNAAIYLSVGEVPMVTKKIPKHFLFLKRFNSLPVSQYITLADGDSVIINGTTVRAIATPGHTVGSMCYLVNGALFTGDLCGLKDGHVTPMVAIFTEDMKGDIASIKQVARMSGISAIYTAHSGFTSDFNGAFSKWK